MPNWDAQWTANSGNTRLLLRMCNCWCQIDRGFIALGCTCSMLEKMYNFRKKRGKKEKKARSGVVAVSVPLHHDDLALLFSSFSYDPM